MSERLWVVTYDVSDGRRLRKVARIMERFGVRVQKSVFECRLRDAQLDELRHALSKVMHSPPDSVRFYTLCKDCQQFTEATTGIEILETRTFYIV